MSEQQSSASPVIVFYSYAHEDEALRNELAKHISLLQRQGIITTWYDRQIAPGTGWAHVIDSHLKEAAIILLLISPDFMASDYCYSNEMQFALDRHKQGLAHVIPILLRPVDWQEAPFSHLQYLPSNKRPVTMWESRDAAFLEVVTGIRAVVAQIRGSMKQTASLSSNRISNKNRQRILKRVRAFWIQGMLNQSLHQSALIALGLQEQPDALTNPWRLIVQETEQSIRPLPPGTRIIQVYDEADGELLILGEPGSGKTTLLLELARDLLDRAEQDETHPMPIVFNLSSWAVRHQPLVDWLAEELNLKYQVSSQLAKSWISTNRILPLLDGLDEVAPTHRVACLEEINTYRGEHDLVPLVVCSRSKEYFSQTTRILLHNAVTVQPLTVQQIDEYLVSAGEQLTALHAILHQDEVLLKLATNPLILSVLTLTYHGKSVEELTTSESPEVRRRQIFAAYVQRMFEHRGVVARYTTQQTIHWLGWLASQMALHNQTEFYLESMQPDWLWGKRLRRCYEWTVGRPMYYLVEALHHAVYSGLSAVLVVIFANAIFVGINKVLLGVLIGIFLGGGLITLVSGIIYGWRKGLYTAFVGIPIGAMTGALINMIAPGLDRPIMGLVLGLITGAITGLLASIIAGNAYSYSGIFVNPVLGWSWENVRRGFKGELKEELALLMLGGIAVILVGAVVTIERGFLSGLCMGGVMVLASLLLFVLNTGMRSTSLSKDVLIMPNQGIHLSARKGLYFCLAAGICAFTGSWLIISYVAGPAIGWQCGLVVGVLYGLANGWLEGWNASVRHMVLRVLLWHTRSLPRNYARFLDYATERILLRKIGGGYVFIHRLLLEYFALLAITWIESEHAQTANPSAKDATIYHNRGLIFAEFNEYDQAIMNYTRAIELAPKETSVYRDRGLTYARCKEYQQAIADYTSAIELEPKNVWIYLQRGRAYQTLKEYEKAIADFTQAITLESERAILYGERAWAYLFNKEYEEAIADFSRTIELVPKNGWFYRDRGSAYIYLKEYEKAIVDFTHVIELQPSNADLYSRRGYASLHINAYEEAIADFTHAIELDATHRSAYLGRGRTYLWLKKRELASTDFVQHATLMPNSGEAAWIVIFVNFGKQHPDSMTVENLEKIAAITPQSSVAQICQGVALGLQNNYSAGIMQLEKSIQLGKSIQDAYFWKGLLYAYLGQGTEATQSIMQALEAGLPPILLKPLYWLEQEQPEMYQTIAMPFLVQYGV